MIFGTLQSHQVHQRRIICPSGTWWSHTIGRSSHFRLLPYVSHHDKKLLKEIAQQINDEREESGFEEDWFTDLEGSDYEGSEDEEYIPWIFSQILFFFSIPPLSRSNQGQLQFFILGWVSYFEIVFSVVFIFWTICDILTFQESGLWSGKIRNCRRHAFYLQ